MAAAPPAGAGPLRRLLRRTVLRALRPYTAQQRMIDERILDAIDELERRAGERDQLELDLLVEDIVSSLDNLRSRVAAGEDLVAGSRALPYTAGGVLEHFSAPVGGMVLGYRGGADTHEGAYVSFEEVFRGSEERVRERQRGLSGAACRTKSPCSTPAADGASCSTCCESAAIAAMGVDLDEGMVERSRAKGHEVELGEVNGYLERLSDGELGAVFSAQVIEHIPYKELMRFLELSHAKLRPGGVFVAETVNPHAPHALKTFWVDPTHQHPVFPEVALDPVPGRRIRVGLRLPSARHRPRGRRSLRRERVRARGEEGVRFCTVAHAATLPHARVLAGTLARAPPGSLPHGARRRARGRRPGTSEPFEVLRPADLRVPGWETLLAARRWADLREFFKPHLLSRLIAEGAETSVFLDAAVDVHAPLEPVSRALERHGAVVAPRLLGELPIDGRRPDRDDLRQAGARRRLAGRRGTAPGRRGARPLVGRAAHALGAASPHCRATSRPLRATAQPVARPGAQRLRRRGRAR